MKSLYYSIAIVCLVLFVSVSLRLADPLQAQSISKNNGYISMTVLTNSGECSVRGRTDTLSSYHNLTGASCQGLMIDGSFLFRIGDTPSSSGSYADGVWVQWNNERGLGIRQECFIRSLGDTPGRLETVLIRTSIWSGDGATHVVGHVFSLSLALGSSILSTSEGNDNYGQHMIYRGANVPDIWNNFTSGWPPNVAGPTSIGILGLFEATPPDVFYDGCCYFPTIWNDTIWMDVTGGGPWTSTAKWNTMTLSPSETLRHATYVGIIDPTSAQGVIRINRLQPLVNNCGITIPNTFSWSPLLLNANWDTLRNLNMRVSHFTPGSSLSAGTNPLTASSLYGFCRDTFPNWVLHVNTGAIMPPCFSLITTFDRDTASYVDSVRLCLPTTTGTDFLIDATVSDQLCGASGVVTLGVNFVGCPGTPPYHYYWFPPTGLSNDTIDSPTATVSVSTTYTLTVMDATFRQAVDSVVVSIHPLPTVAGQGDTTCVGFPLTLSATSITGTNYHWMPVDSHQAVIHPTTAGPYWVTVTDNFGCVSLPDTVAAYLYSNLTINLGNDTTICQNSYLWLNPHPSVPGGAYLWSNGDTVSTIQISQDRWYWVRYTGPGGCNTVTDSIRVHVLPLPVVTLSAHDTFYCFTGGVAVTAFGTPAGGHFTWSTGETTATVNLSSPDPEIPHTTYTVTYTGPNGCQADGGLMVTRYAPTLTVPDTNVCCGDTVTIEAVGIPNGGNFYWPGRHLPFLASQTFTMSGNYPVSYTSYNTNCTVWDTARVVFNPSPRVYLQAETTMCAGMTMELVPTVSMPGGTFRWNNGATTPTIWVGDTMFEGIRWASVVYTMPSGCASPVATSRVTETPIIRANTHWMYTRLTDTHPVLDTTFEILTSCTDTVHWEMSIITSDTGWATVTSPMSGIGPATVNVHFNMATASFGEHGFNLLIEHPDGLVWPWEIQMVVDYSPNYNIGVVGPEASNEWHPVIVNRGDFYMTPDSERIIISNNDTDISIDLGLNMTYDSTVIRVSAGDGIGVDRFLLYGRFDAEEYAPDPGAFWSDHKINMWAIPHYANGTIFGPGGVNIPPGGQSSLWLKFIAPEYYSVEPFPTLNLRVYSRIHMP